MEEAFDKLDFTLLQAKLWVYKYRTLAQLLGLKTTDYEQLDTLLKELNRLRLEFNLHKADDNLELARSITIPPLELKVIAPYYQIKYPSYITLSFELYNDELVAIYSAHTERAYESLLQKLSQTLPIPLMLEPKVTTVQPRYLGQNHLGSVYLTGTKTRAHTVGIYTDQTRQWLVKEVVLAFDDCVNLDVEVYGDYLITYEVIYTSTPTFYLSKCRVYDIINDVIYPTEINLPVMWWKLFEFVIEGDILIVLSLGNIYQYNYKTNTEVAKIKLDADIDELNYAQNNFPKFVVLNRVVCVVQDHYCRCYDFTGKILFNDKVEFNRIFKSKDKVILANIN